MTRYTLLPILALILLLSGACRRQADNPKPTAREQWHESLKDSITRISGLRSQDSLRILALRENIDSKIAEFSVVDNPREVEPYYILTAFRNNYPLNSTGISARMTNDQRLELVAALSGKRFNSIRIKDDSGRYVQSERVPADQGLNYTSGGLTTVALSGAAADSIGTFIAANPSRRLDIEYLQDGNVIHSATLSADRKRWVADTRNLTYERALLDSLENAMILNARKIEILHLTLRQK